MYKLISILSFLIRQFCLPNPFECFGDSAILINLIAGIVIAPIAYLIVGIVYDKGSAPVAGSILYFVTYSLITGLLCIMGIKSFAWWWILLVAAVFCGIVILFRWLCTRPSASDYYD